LQVSRSDMRRWWRAARVSCSCYSMHHRSPPTTDGRTRHAVPFFLYIYATPAGWAFTGPVTPATTEHPSSTPWPVAVPVHVGRQAAVLSVAAFFAPFLRQCLRGGPSPLLLTFTYALLKFERGS